METPFLIRLFPCLLYQHKIARAML